LTWQPPAHLTSHSIDGQACVATNEIWWKIIIIGFTRRRCIQALSFHRLHFMGPQHTFFQTIRLYHPAFSHLSYYSLTRNTAAPRWCWDYLCSQVNLPGLSRSYASRPFCPCTANHVPFSFLLPRNTQHLFFRLPCAIDFPYHPHCGYTGSFFLFVL
jgi:hypothetical protein